MPGFKHLAEVVSDQTDCTLCFFHCLAHIVESASVSPLCLAHTVESATSYLLFLFFLVSPLPFTELSDPVEGQFVSWRSLLPSYWWSNFDIHIYIYIHTLPSHVRGLATLVELQVALINHSIYTRAAQPCVSALIIIHLCSAGGGQSIFTRAANHVFVRVCLQLFLVEV